MALQANYNTSVEQVTFSTEALHSSSFFQPQHSFSNIITPAPSQLSFEGIPQPNHNTIDKPKVVSRSQSPKLTTWFSLKQKDRAVLPKPKVIVYIGSSQKSF